MQTDKRKISEYRQELSSQQIQERVAELGVEMNRDLKDKKVVVIGVLNGAFIFMADLVRLLTMPVEVDFVRVASYGNRSVSCGEISCKKDVELPLENKHVILVEDIVDTGRTLSWLKDYFREMPVAEIKTCALIDKKERREVPLDVDYIGFHLEKGFLVGYGLDYREQHRNYPAIYNLDNPV
ncbi:MAG: hypoxanthine phosphoribosyltransferase [Desulfurivibrionaceae bacterium]